MKERQSKVVGFKNFFPHGCQQTLDMGKKFEEISIKDSRHWLQLVQGPTSKNF